jgi:hypothetical protein
VPGSVTPFCNSSRIAAPLTWKTWPLPTALLMSELMSRSRFAVFGLPDVPNTAVPEPDPSSPPKNEPRKVLSSTSTLQYCIAKGRARSAGPDEGTELRWPTVPAYQRVGGAQRWSAEHR